MLRTSFPAGKVFGVDLRVHLSFPLLLALAVGYSLVVNNNGARGFGLWLALVFAVMVREVARAIAGAYSGLNLRALFLLPVGGVMAFAPRHGKAPADTRLVTVAGPVANFLVGLLMLGTCYAMEPGIGLVEMPWVSASHVLRSFVWLQFILGLVGCLPSTLPSKPVLARKATDESANHGSGQRSSSPFPAALNVGTMISLATTVLGLAVGNLWLVMLGGFFFLAAQFGSSTQQALSSPEAESIRVRDVMLTEYTLLSASETLTGALNHTVHSLQDVFPVVRGDRLVGSIARPTLSEALQTNGDSYLQGLMTKTLHSAAPEEKLVEALRRTAALGASEFIPVVEDGSMLGILTPQSLSRAVQMVKTERTPGRGGE
jgi:predicted transcriptional regulator